MKILREGWQYSRPYTEQGIDSWAPLISAYEYSGEDKPFSEGDPGVRTLTRPGDKSWADRIMEVVGQIGLAATFGALGAGAGAASGGAAAAEPSIFSSILSGAVEGVPQGAITGASASIPSALKKGSVSPLLSGAVLGGVAGGIQGGISGMPSDTLTQATEAVTSSGGAPDAIPIIQDMIDTANYNKAILSGAAGAATSADPGVSPQGEVNIPPTGSLDTLESLIENTVESRATNLPSELGLDPIPNTGAPMETVAPTGTPSPEFSGMSMPDTTPGVSTMDLKQAAGDVYKAANAGLRVKNVLDLLQNISKAKNNPKIAAMQNTNAMPVGAINPTLGNMAGNEKNKAWGAVLV